MRGKKHRASSSCSTWT